MAKDNSGGGRNAGLFEDALAYHQMGRPGKLEIQATKPMATQRDLSLAYSPGVAAPVLAVAEDPDTSYEYTTRGNMVAVITNGTAILGLGNRGALAAKPVMEGKAVLFKRFADVDAFDLEVDTEDPDKFVEAVRLVGAGFGGINLEDIKAPECFVIEQRLKEEMDIPVFHDDQHGTAIICAAGLINALHLTERKIEDCKIVLNGAGAAGIACLELIKAMGAKPENCIACDTKGVIYQGRKSGMNQWKSAHAVKTEARSLAQAIKGADVFLGVSVKGALTPEMVRSMADRPIIFAMANPDPEITPEEAAEVRADAIIATGRSDYPNQVNNVLGFPYIFRGALDARARTINDAMKIAAAEALAELAREDVPEEVAAAYGTRLSYGPNYIIPAPFDPRLVHKVPAAVARAAVESGVARKPIVDFDGYEQSLRQRLDPSASILQVLQERLRARPKRVVFAEGEDERVARGALSFQRQRLGQAVLVGARARVEALLAEAGWTQADDGPITIVDPDKLSNAAAHAEALYKRLQRRGFTEAECRRLIQQNRNVLGASLLQRGEADAMVTGATRKNALVYNDVLRVIDPQPGESVHGVTAVLTRGRTVLVADTMVADDPCPTTLVHIAKVAARVARRLGLEPRVAMLSFATFGYPITDRAERAREAARMMHEEGVDFEVDGEMAADVALDPDYMAQYPFCRLSGPANVLVTPSRDSASIATKMLKQLAGATLIGPVLVGLEHPVQICSMNASAADIVMMATLAGVRVGDGAG